jgi:phosphatidylglycerol---prolipoprotein diacylglyceryl transferase
VLSEIDVLGLSIKTFGLFFGLNFVLVGLIAARRLKELGKPVDWAYEMTFAALVGGLVGSRLWWVLDNLDEVRDDVLGGLFGGSGLTWYGGLIGGAITVSLWAWRRGMLNRSLLDLAATPLALGYAVGRIGCQVAADGDYGKPWDGPWAMAYPDGVVPTDDLVHPTPIYESLAMTVVGLVCWNLRDRLAPGRVFAIYLVGYGLQRFLVEFVRRNPDVALGLTTAQLLSLAMLVAGTVWLVTTRGAGSAGPRLGAPRRAAPSGGARPARRSAA